MAMKTCAVYLAGTVVLATLAHGVRGQSTATPPPAVPAEVASSVPVAQAKPAGLAGCISAICSACRGHKQRCCTTPFGQLLNGMAKPLNFMTGGIIPTPCPSPTEPGGPGADPATAPGGPAGAAATAEKIKKEEAQAKARCQATRYLGTVPCHYYPEAEAALIASLRTDRSECVRWEAARALGNGCCCTKKTIQALTITVSGNNKDGNPAEVSPRVKAAACKALSLCVNRIGGAIEPLRPELPPDPKSVPRPYEPQRPELPPDPQSGRALIGTGVQAVAYYTAAETQPVARVVAEAQRVLAQVGEPQMQSAGPGTGKRNLYDLWQSARDEPQAVAEVSSLAAQVTSPPPQPIGRSLARLPGIPAAGRGPGMQTAPIPVQQPHYPLAAGPDSPLWAAGSPVMADPVMESIQRQVPILDDAGLDWRPDYPPAVSTQPPPWNPGHRPVMAASWPERARLEYPPANGPAGMYVADPRTHPPHPGPPTPHPPPTGPSAWGGQPYPPSIGAPSTTGNPQVPRTALRDNPWSYDARGSYPAGNFRGRF